MNPKAFEMPHNPERCPVLSYVTYASLCPENYSSPESPFYIAVNKKRPGKPSEWFKKQPVGANKIGGFVKYMVDFVGIKDDRHLTNTSYRKHLAARLNESWVPKDVGRHVTGHKQASSLDNYAPLSNKQQKILSDIVGGISNKMKFVAPLASFPTPATSIN